MDKKVLFTHLKLQDVCQGSWIGSRDISATSSKKQGAQFDTFSPIDGGRLASVISSTESEIQEVIKASDEAFEVWRNVPAPRRGELVRIFGNRLRGEKKRLAELITLEVGKIPSEAEGEVQEMIDICDFALGLSRQLYGLTIATERPGHRLMEQWHPLGPVAVISAFNFPMAVWSWNTAIALVCGDTIIWKPSEKAPLCALACHKILSEVIDSFEGAPEGLACLINGGKEVGEAISKSTSIPLVAATGSVATGKAVGSTVANRLGRTLLELGGNNGMIVTPNADLDLAVRAITFSSVGTGGQRCTTLRRLLVHESIKDTLRKRLQQIFSTIKIGSPLEEGVLIGPLIDMAAKTAYRETLKTAVSQGGVVYNDEDPQDVPSGGSYVKPALVEIASDAEILKHETFAPILYIVAYKDFDEALRIHNNVPQGLSSAIFTNDIREAETFLSAKGSDCGIANVNIGTSGAEIGGAFGGEKDTGGGRQSGSDSWKNYMRRATNTINYSKELPLAQGVRFDTIE